MVVEKLLGEGYYVIVDEEGCEAVPDVVAIKPGGPEKWSNVIECFEVETYPDKSLTREKIMWFKDKAKRNNCSSLTIVVPEEYVELVRKRLDEVKVGFNVLGLRVSVEFVDWLYEKMLGEGIPGAIDRDGKIYLTRETVEAYHRETGREISLSDASRLVHGVYRTLRVHGRVVRVVELPPHFSARKEE